MTVTSRTCVAHFPCDNTSRVFPLPFDVGPDAEVRGMVRFADAAEHPLKYGSDFTATTSSSGTSVTCPPCGTPYPEGTTLSFRRSTDYRETLDIVENDPFPSKLIEDEFDRSTLRDQELLESASRTMGFRITTRAEDRASAEDFLDTMQRAAAEACNASTLARTALALTHNEEGAAEFSAGSAQFHADRAVRASTGAENRAGWWTDFDAVPARCNAMEFTVPGNRTDRFPPSLALRFTDAETLLPVTGHVARSTFSDDETRVRVTCIIPETIHILELGQPVESSPSPLLTFLPVVHGPSAGVESGVMVLDVARLDGASFSSGAEFECSVQKTADDADITEQFTLDAADPYELRITLPSVDADTPCRLRLRVRDGLPDWSPWSGPYAFTVREAALAGDNDALFAPTAADWPSGDASERYSKTVSQEADQSDWMSLAPEATYDPTATALNVEHFDGSTLVLTHASPTLLADGETVIADPGGGAACTLIRCGTVVQTGTGPFTYTCTGLTGAPASITAVWAAPVLLIAYGAEGEKLRPDTETTVTDGTDPARPVVSSPLPGLFRTSDLNNTIIAVVNGAEEERTCSESTASGSGPYTYTLHLDTPLSGPPSSIRKKTAFTPVLPASALHTDNTAPEEDTMSLSAHLLTPPDAFRTAAMGFALPTGNTPMPTEARIALWKTE